MLKYFFFQSLNYILDFGRSVGAHSDLRRHFPRTLLEPESRSPADLVENHPNILRKSLDPVIILAGLILRSQTKSQHNCQRLHLPRITVQVNNQASSYFRVDTELQGVH